MKIYTAVNYEWKNDKLVKLSSDSYEYEGEVEQAGGSGGTPKPPKIKIKTPKIKIQKIKNKIPKVKNKIPKITIPKKPTIISNLQKAVAGGTTQLKKNLQSAASTTKSNIHGVTTAARTGLHEGTSAARAGVHAATSAGRAELHRGADTLKAIWDQARGKGGKDEGGQAGGSKQAMGSGTEVSEKSGKYGSKGQLTTSKRKKGNRGKEGLKVRVA